MSNKQKQFKRREKLIIIRKSKGLTQAEVALLLVKKFHVKITKQFVGAIERGEKDPSLEIAIAIAKLYNLTVEILFD